MKMNKTNRRLKVLHGHLNRNISVCIQPSSTTVGASRQPAISVTPNACLVDEKIVVRISGLDAREVVTLITDVKENRNTFESRCLYRANDKGIVDTRTSPSIGGSYEGVDQMGPFWSVSSVDDPRIRFIKKNVAKPMDFRISAYRGEYTATKNITTAPVAEAHVHRGFMRSGVKRIPLKSGPVKGTLFIPDGEGPFPGVVDMYGALISLVETRAALLASHGYATLALSYMYSEGLPQNAKDVDFGYLMSAYEWFYKQPYVDETRLGTVGLCLGGLLSLIMTSVFPQIKASVSINSVSAVPAGEDLGSPESKRSWWDGAKPENVFATDEGIVINDIFDGNNSTPIPAWQNGAHILTIVGEDDKQTKPRWSTYFYDHCPPEFKHQIQVRHYEGAGHLIEPPYMPHVRAFLSPAQRMKSVDFIPEKFHGMPMLTGGFPKEHAHAQEDSWKHVLVFLEKHLKS